MKKLVSLALALCMACMLIPAMAEETLAGDWYAPYYGMELTLSLKEDGTAALIIPEMGSTGESTWKLDGEQFIFTDTETGESLVGSYADGKIVLEQEEERLEFTREHPEIAALADANQNAAAEDFEGTWAISLVSVGQMRVEADVAGMDDITVTIKDGTASFAGNADSVTFFFGTEPLAMTFENGALVYSVELANDAEPITISMKAEILTDGMLAFNIDTGYGEMAMYFIKAATGKPSA